MANGYRPCGLCCIKGCDKPIWGQGFCQAHYSVKAGKSWSDVEPEGHA